MYARDAKISLLCFGKGECGENSFTIFASPGHKDFVFKKVRHPLHRMIRYGGCAVKLQYFPFHTKRMTEIFQNFPENLKNL